MTETPIDALPEAWRRWIEADDEHRDTWARLLRDDPDEVARSFSGRIAFGTAGLRAEMGPGPRRMNRLVVRQATAGLMHRLPAGALVVVGYDARHNSQRFAAEVVDVVVARGGRVAVVDRPAPTPVVAKAVLDQGAAAGVVITASHNPAVDNGYKLYLGDGIQLVPPADAEIAAAIDAEVTADPGVPTEGAAGSVTDIATEALAAHRQAAVAAVLTGHRDVRLLYTAMHGVGGAHLLDCFETAGFPAPHVVDAQFEPDPDFPTAPFPNPEEAGALDLAMAEAERLAAEGSAVDLILANDPDADRLAVAAPAPGGGSWRRLTGDQVGVLLADHVLRNRPADQVSEGIRDLVASSVVSSRFIDAVAAHHGAESIRTLTGFKWVARPIVDRPDDRYRFGYEEALGYCVGDRVRDKDGISAALVMAELAAECRASGGTVWDRLDELVARHGCYATDQLVVGLAGMDDSAQDETKRRALGLDPEVVAGAAVSTRIDLSLGEHFPPTSGLILELADGSRVIVRPSGTEPKIKIYLEAVARPEGSENADEARQRAELRLKDLGRAVSDLVS